MFRIKYLSRWVSQRGPASLSCFAVSLILAGLLVLESLGGRPVFGQSGWILAAGLAWAGRTLARRPPGALRLARICGCIAVYSGLAAGEALNAGAAGPWLGKLLVQALHLPAGSTVATLALAASALGIGVPLWAGRNWPDLLERWGERIEGACSKAVGWVGLGRREAGHETVSDTATRQPGETHILSQATADSGAFQRPFSGAGQRTDETPPPAFDLEETFAVPWGTAAIENQSARVDENGTAHRASSPREQVAADLAWIQGNLERRYRRRAATQAPAPARKPGEQASVMMDEGEIQQRLMKIHGGRIPGGERRRPRRESQPAQGIPRPMELPLELAPAKPDRLIPAMAARPSGNPAPNAAPGRPMAGDKPHRVSPAKAPEAPAAVPVLGALPSVAVPTPAPPLYPVEEIIQPAGIALPWPGQPEVTSVLAESVREKESGAAAVPESTPPALVPALPVDERSLPEAQHGEAACDQPPWLPEEVDTPFSPLVEVFQADPVEAAPDPAPLAELEFAAQDLPALEEDDEAIMPDAAFPPQLPLRLEPECPPSRNHWEHYDPPLSLLQAPEYGGQSINSEELARQGRLIQEKLAEFKVNVAVQDACAGPVITRYEVEPAVGVRGSQVVNLMKDLARALGVTSIRVVETIPGKTYMGLELPNPRRQMIRLSEVLSSEVFLSHGSKLAMALGKDIVGNPVVADLAKAPHMLVAGTTGSGKSVGVNAMILSLLYRASPDEVRFVMIDPKMLELSVYDGIPHLLAPVVTDMKLAANALNWCVGEMERRYRLMSALGVRNLAGYNQKVAHARAAGRPLFDPFPLVPESPAPLEPLPFIVVVVDEFADLMMVAGKKIEELIARLAQKARAAGIHLILATQRPSVDVITGLIKANIPTRIAFQVSSKIDSRTILDQMGAETLLGQGDMLYLPPGTGYPQRVHGAFVADEEVHALAEHLKQYGEPDYVEAVLGSAPESEQGEAGGTTEETDPLYDQAVAIVIDSRRASISLIQRHLRIGYNRAARLVEQMEVSGIVSPMESNGNRTVLVPAS